MALYPVLFSELYKIMVNKVTFAYFRGGNRPPLWTLVGYKTVCATVEKNDTWMMEHTVLCTTSGMRHCLIHAIQTLNSCFIVLVLHCARRAVIILSDKPIVLQQTDFIRTSTLPPYN